MGSVKLDTSGLSKKMKKVFEGSIDSITRQCEKYAANKLQEAYDNRTFQNDTYNLKDSYVWAVYYNGSMKSRGFLDEPDAFEPQVFHGMMIIGRNEAESFLATYSSRVSRGWEIVIGAIAPYGSYLEGDNFVVMSYIFDEVTQDFGSANVMAFYLNYGF